MPGPQIAGVPAIPNVSQVRGKLMRVDSEMDGSFRWEIQVEEARDVNGLSNFVRAYIGSPIQVFIHPQFQSTFVVGDVLEARIAFRGDERGGRFFLLDDAVHRL